MKVYWLVLILVLLTASSGIAQSTPGPTVQPKTDQPATRLRIDVDLGQSLIFGQR